jgi:hypothetical protein
MVYTSSFSPSIFQIDPQDTTEAGPLIQTTAQIAKYPVPRAQFTRPTSTAKTDIYLDRCPSNGDSQTSSRRKKGRFVAEAALAEANPVYFRRKSNREPRPSAARA